MNNGFVAQAMEQGQALTKLWMDSISELTGAVLSYSPGSPPPEMGRQMREAFLSALGHSVDSYMRSEPFLQSIKQSLDMAMDVRKQFSQNMRSLHHSMGTPSVEDVQSIILGLRHFEERLNRRFDYLMSRLEQIDERMAAIESGVAEQGEDDSEQPEATRSEMQSRNHSRAPGISNKPSRPVKRRMPRSKS